MNDESRRTYVQQFLDGLDWEDAEDQEEIRKIRKRMREREEIRGRISWLHYPDTQDEGSLNTDMSGCPLTREEMRTIRDRHRILEEIARRSPDGRVRSINAARWMRSAGIFMTDPGNAAKSLARHMRRTAETWEAQEPGWFRLVAWTRELEQNNEPQVLEEHEDPALHDPSSETENN
jgi:hypothetical protein